MPKKPGRKRVGRIFKGACKDPAVQLHDKQRSVNRCRIQLKRKQDELERLQREEAALKMGKTPRASKRAKPVVEPVPKVAQTKADEADQRFTNPLLLSPPSLAAGGRLGRLRRHHLRDPQADG